jgi:hypothetical protein
MAWHSVTVFGDQQLSRPGIDGEGVDLVKVVDKWPEGARSGAVGVWLGAREQVHQEEAWLPIGAELEGRVVGVVGVPDCLFVETERASR